jgi:amino acid transporter
MAGHKGGLNWVVAAGVVGADIGTSIFYGTGILFPIVGYLAPFLVLITCFLMWLFKATYQEGLALSPYNGGAYSMILRTVGRRFAVVAGALTFVSYLATAAVSAISGGLYFSSLFENGLSSFTVVLFSFFPIILFALLNTKGIKEPAKLVTAIAGTHFGLLIIISIWGLIYLGWNYSEIDFTKLQNIKPNGELTVAMVLYGFAASFLGITGFESAAQIVEELEEPAIETIRKLYKTVVILVSITAPLISFLCLILLTTEEVQNNLGSLLSSLANKLGGKILLTIIVIDATLTLFAAVNTAFVGFIGLTTTMAKQGNLPSLLLTRVAHKYPKIQGYPLIALPFGLIAMATSAYVAGEIDIAAKVYEIAFLGVMVSFAVGVVLMRNRAQKKSVPAAYVSRWIFHFKNA